MMIGALISHRVLYAIYLGIFSRFKVCCIKMFLKNSLAVLGRQICIFTFITGSYVLTIMTWQLKTQILINTQPVYNPVTSWYTSITVKQHIVSVF